MNRPVVYFVSFVAALALGWPWWASAAFGVALALSIVAEARSE